MDNKNDHSPPSSSFSLASLVGLEPVYSKGEIEITDRTVNIIPRKFNAEGLPLAFDIREFSFDFEPIVNSSRTYFVNSIDRNFWKKQKDDVEKDSQEQVQRALTLKNKLLSKIF